MFLHNSLSTDTTVIFKYFRKLKLVVQNKNGVDRLKVQYAPIESLPEHNLVTNLNKIREKKNEKKKITCKNNYTKLIHKRAKYCLVFSDFARLQSHII